MPYRSGMLVSKKIPYLRLANERNKIKKQKETVIRWKMIENMCLQPISRKTNLS